jgi:alditol oxidase
VVRNWAGNVTFAAQRLHRPGSVDELQHLVASTPRIRALGTGHSFNRIADTTGDLVTVAGITGDTVLDEQRMTVDIRAGATYGELGAQLAASGWALHNLGSLPHISVAGACATGTHGSGDANACLAAAAVAVEFVRGDGELVRVSDEDPAFPGSVLALGALGVVTRLTLAVQPTYGVRQNVWLDAPLATVADRLGEIMSSGYSVSLFTDWSRPDRVDKIWTKSRTDEEPLDGQQWGARRADTPQHPITGEDASAATGQLGVAGSWHERLPHFRAEFTPSVGHEQQSEYLLPREHGPAALLALRAIDLRPALAVCEVRTVAPDELWLSPCHDRDTVAFHFTWVDDDELVHRAVTTVERAFAPFGARPHWGKVFAMDRDEVAAHYPQLAGVGQLAAQHDPERRFGNMFLERFLYS